ncbi:hypothetical protein PHMEG_00022071 [Phytophthora megakarya]|uniref:Uncharacterized protein n=1 Tax=Phytophthora megakarya TaxID=4795 RepID=A0A225VKB9_9STRA|nr:hypothetical protein PHMEG_00022071 [Phytophthora megakarya]
MSMLIQILSYTNALNLENPEMLSGLQILWREQSDKKESKTNSAPRQETTSKTKLFCGKGRFKQRFEGKRTENRTCHFYKKTDHIKSNCYA